MAKIKTIQLNQYEVPFPKLNAIRNKGSTRVVFLLDELRGVIQYYKSDGQFFLIFRSYGTWIGLYHSAGD